MRDGADTATKGLFYEQDDTTDVVINCCPLASAYMTVGRAYKSDRLWKRFDYWFAKLEDPNAFTKWWDACGTPSKLKALITKVLKERNHV